MTAYSYVRLIDLAKGGMGRVELAVRKEGDFERLYAVKRLLGSHEESAEFRQMFLDEARIAGLINHPNVVSVLDVGEDDEGPFLVMDYVEGASIGRLIRRLNAEGREVPLTVALRALAQAADGLHAAHELTDHDGRPLNVVHRDVSPQNILLGLDGHARVADFGIAKALGRRTRTSTGVLKGKLGYMSPEQLRFEEPDRRSDLFSLGVVAYELLVGKRLYANADGMDGARRALNDPPPDLSEERIDAPPQLTELMFRLLAKQPEQRPESAKQVAQELRAICSYLEYEEDVAPEIADFVHELVGEELEERTRSINAARTLQRSNGFVPATAPEALDPVPEAELREQPTRIGRRPSKKRAVWIVGALVALLGGAAFALVATSSNELVLPPAEKSPLATVPPPSPVIVQAPSVDPEQDLTNAVEHPVAAEPSVEPPSERPRSTMRRRRQGSRSRMTSDISSWGWQ